MRRRRRKTADALALLGGGQLPRLAASLHSEMAGGFGAGDKGYHAADSAPGLPNDCFRFAQAWHACPKHGRQAWSF